jgi:hypothetical protein
VLWRLFTSFIAVALGGIIILSLIREHRQRKPALQTQT